MRRRHLLTAAGSLAAAAAAGCTSNGDGTPTEEPAQGDDTTTVSESNRAIVVSSTGEATGDPDLAVLEFAVEATGDTAGAVRDELATRSEALRAALLEYGLDEDAVTTEHYGIFERIDRRRMEQEGVRPDDPEAVEEYRYYQGTHAFRVEVAAIDEVGAVIDAAVDGGADSVGRVTFTLSEKRRDALRDEALRSALQDARDEAETIAAEIGASISEATVVDASDARVSPVHREFAAGGDGGAMPEPTPSPSTGVEPGEVTVTADVRVRYRMA